MQILVHPSPLLPMDRRPVEFVDQIRNMAAAGVTTFVEVGPGSTLTKLVESILDGTPHQAVAIGASTFVAIFANEAAASGISLWSIGPVRLT